MKYIEKRMQNEKYKIVVFSDLHYAPELPLNNGSKIDRKLISFAEAILENKNI